MARPKAPPPLSPPSDKLRGKWKGLVHTYRQELPVVMWFNASGDVHAQLGDQPTSRVNDPGFDKGWFTGKMPGNIGTPDANRRPYDLQWELTLREGRLSGALYAVGRHPSRGLMLGHWVQLQKQEEE